MLIHIITHQTAGAIALVFACFSFAFVFFFLRVLQFPRTVQILLG